MVQVQMVVRVGDRRIARFVWFSTWRSYTSWLLTRLELWRAKGLVKRAYRSAPTALTDLAEISLRKGNLELFAREVA